MFSGSVREATQTKDARVQEAEAKAIPDQEAAATEGHVAPVQGEPEEIERLKEMERQKDMERQKELEHFVSSERERLKGYSYLTAEDLRSTVSSEPAALNSRRRQEFQAQMVAADERWCANHPVECAEKKAREAREEAIRNEARMQAEQMARDDAQRAERRDRDDAQRLVDDMQRNISSGHSRDQLRSDLSMATQSGGPKTQDVERQIEWDLTVSPSPSQMPAPQESVLPQNKGLGAPNVTLSPEAITNFESYPPKVQKLLTSALELTTRNLDYKYGSADPANGGMDCSGFVYYVLNQNGVAPYVPDDSKDQYIWLRSAGTFEPVVSGKDDSFELKELKPGDLLFWSGTYSIERDPPITHAMIYLGREKKTGARVMVGASDGRTYQGQQRFGVSVFEFKMPQTENSEASEGRERPRFIGYGHIPGLNN